jgi:hypothetical protein
MKTAVAARYSGVSSLLICRDREKTDLRRILNRLVREGGGSLVPYDAGTSGLIPLGAPLKPVKGGKDGAGMLRSIYDRYLESVTQRRYAERAHRTQPMEGLSGDDIKTRRLYMDGMINLLLIQGNPGEAESLAQSGAGEDAPVYSLFLKLYAGDLKAARSIMGRSAAIMESPEYRSSGASSISCPEPKYPRHEKPGGLHARGGD